MSFQNDSHDLGDSEESGTEELYDLEKQLEHNLADLFLKDAVLYNPGRIPFHSRNHETAFTDM